MALTEQDREKQLAIAERLQLKWLERMEKLIDEGNITPTEMTTLARVLSQNGWSLDPALLPKGLKDKLQAKTFDPTEEEDVLPFKMRA